MGRRWGRTARTGLVIAATAIVAAPATALVPPPLPTSAPEAAAAAGGDLLVTPSLLRVAAGAELTVVLGSGATDPLLLDVGVVSAEPGADGDITVTDRTAPWLEAQGRGVVIAPGESVVLAIGVTGPLPVDGVAVVEVTGSPVTGGEAVTVSAVALSGVGDSDGPVVVAVRDEGGVQVTVTVARPSLVGVAAASRRDSARTQSLLAVPGTPVTVRLPIADAEAVEVVDDTGRTAGITFTPEPSGAIGPVAAAAAAAVLLTAGVLVARRRARADAHRTST